MSAAVLKLNAAYMPLELISFRKAISLIERGKAEIIEYYDNKYFRTYKDTYNAPCVIRLFHFIAPHKDLKFYKPFTRKNLLCRDGGVCGYCGKKLSLKSLTLDHIIPKSKNGLTNFQNIICACVSCNRRKNNRTPDEANMKLLRKPYAPLIADSFEKGMLGKLKEIIKISASNKKWLTYCYWNLELDQDKVK